MILSQTKKIQFTEISLRYDVMFERESNVTVSNDVIENRLWYWQLIMEDKTKIDWKFWWSNHVLGDVT